MFIFVQELTIHTAPHPLVRRSPNPRHSIEDTRMQWFGQNSAIFIRGVESYSSRVCWRTLYILEDVKDDEKDEKYD